MLSSPRFWLLTSLPSTLATLPIGDLSVSLLLFLVLDCLVGNLLSRDFTQSQPECPGPQPKCAPPSRPLTMHFRDIRSASRYLGCCQRPPVGNKVGYLP